jgi:hypothetical protein
MDYITARHIVKTHISALNCATQSEASEEVNISNIYRS